MLSIFILFSNFGAKHLQPMLHFEHVNPDIHQGASQSPVLLYDLSGMTPMVVSRSDETATEYT